ncbi:hypothetical protein ABTZ03_03255 [Kitasatospora sp. NPDC096077]|uniref:hypothetical protein n=1 Tax=Kitasatospora sp. NPDC096077 TaxID=3155544 RepID=UPI003333EFC1
MSLYEISLRTPETPVPDADECPSCLYFDALDADHFEHPTIRRKIAKWREQHIADRECMAVPDGE